LSESRAPSESTAWGFFVVRQSLSCVGYIQSLAQSLTQ
jgi:hypothetical protein